MMIIYQELKKVLITLHSGRKKEVKERRKEGGEGGRWEGGRDEAEKVGRGSNLASSKL